MDGTLVVVQSRKIKEIRKWDESKKIENNLILQLQNVILLQRVRETRQRDGKVSKNKKIEMKRTLLVVK